MKNLIIVALAAIPSSVFSQGLFDIAPNDEASESVRINYSTGVSIGFDQNVNPGRSDEKSSSTFGAFIGANAITVNPRSTIDYYARYQGNFNTEDGSGSGSLFNNVNGGLSYTFRASERLRFSTRNSLGYELEPDYNYGFANTREIDEYLFWSSENSVGYTWTPKFGVFGGISVDGIQYANENKDANRKNFAPYIQGRYQLNPRTVITSSFRHSIHDNGPSNDASSNIISGGIEHRFSPSAVLVANLGVQFHETDGSGDQTSPHLEFAYRHKISEKTNFRTFVRYENTNYDTSFTGGTYEVNQNLRLGLAMNHDISSKLSLNAGVSYINSDYSDSGTIALPDDTTNLINVYTGFNYLMSRGMYLNGSVNATSSTSGIRERDYDRLRANLGVSYSF
jgi:hypothetical protein